jgi:hypothetical protein
MSCNEKDTIFWSLSKGKKLDSILLFSFKKKNNKWLTDFTSFKNDYKNERSISIIKDYSGQTRNRCNQNETHNFLVIGFYDRHPLNKYIIGLRSKTDTNFLTVRHAPLNENAFNVTYYIRDYDYPHGKARSNRETHLADISDSISYTKSINKGVREKYSFLNIQSNEKLKKMISPKWKPYQSRYGYETDEDFEIRKQEVIEIKFLEKILYDAPKEKRLYVSYLMYSDIDKDGFEEVYIFSVSNGKIVNLDIIEETDNGVQLFPKNESVYNWIKNTDECKLMIRVSLQKHDLLIE